MLSGGTSSKSSLKLHVLTLKYRKESVGMFDCLTPTVIIFFSNKAPSFYTDVMAPNDICVPMCVSAHSFRIAYVVGNCEIYRSLLHLVFKTGILKKLKI